MDSRNVIVGWRELSEHCGLSSAILKRKIAYYGFPKAQLVDIVIKSKVTRAYIWDLATVDRWLSNSKEHFTPRDASELDSERFKFGWKGVIPNGQEKSEEKSSKKNDVEERQVLVFAPSV